MNNPQDLMAPLPALFKPAYASQKSVATIFSRRNICTLRRENHYAQSTQGNSLQSTGTRGWIDSTAQPPLNKPKTTHAIEPTPFQMPITTTKLSKINTAQGGQPLGRLPDEHLAHPEVPNLIDPGSFRQQVLATFLLAFEKFLFDANLSQTLSVNLSFPERSD